MKKTDVAKLTELQDEIDFSISGAIYLRHIDKMQQVIDMLGAVYELLDAMIAEC